MKRLLRFDRRPLVATGSAQLAKSAVVCLAAVLGIAGPISPAGAQSFPRERAFVYGVTNYDGRLYESALAPPAVSTIYLLANRTNVLAPRNTLIYFWPITNQYQADWEQLNELVNGQLEVTQAERVVRTIELSEYVVQYDVSSPEDSLRMYLGAEARAKFSEWEAAQAFYSVALQSFYAAQQRWNDQVNRLRQQSPGGVAPAGAMPPEPQAPTQPTVLSSNPARGFLITLPVGQYGIRLRRADGALQPDSAKTLVMFDKQRDGISYSVVPQARWNAPETSADDSQIVYALRGSTIYLQAFRAGEFDASQYARMLNPQELAPAGPRNRWVPFEPARGVRMVLRRAGAPPKELASQDFYVRQLPGSGLGYEVQLLDPGTGERPSFTGFEIQVSDDDVEVELVDAAGSAIPGSQRRVVALNTSQVWVPYGLSLAPLAIGMIVVAQRRRAVRRVKVAE